MKFDPIKLYKAIISISPNAQYSCDGDCYEGLTWYNDEYKPTEEEVVQKIAELEYQEEVNEYQRQRAAEYPQIVDQQDMQFHDAVNGTTTWKDSIQAVKDKYPKKKMVTKTLNKRKQDALANLEDSRES